MPTPLGNIIDFLKSFGLFDVVLPFLFVFTIVFAILEKTKILGTEEGKPKKNLNTMLAFVIAFFVIAATRIVGVFKEAMPLVVLILIIILSFMLLAGSFMGSEEFSFKERKGWMVFLTLIAFVAIVMVFLGAIKTETGESYLSIFWGWANYNSELFWGIIAVLAMIGLIFYIVHSGGEKGGSEK